MIYLGHGKLELNEGGYSNMTSLFRGVHQIWLCLTRGEGGQNSSKKTWHNLWMPPFTNVVIFLKYPFEVNHYTVLGVLDK